MVEEERKGVSDLTVRESFLGGAQGWSSSLERQAEAIKVKGQIGF